jgi:hypothetical protein
MLLIEILKIVYKKLYLIIIIFLLSFFLLSNSSLLQDKYVLKRFIVIGEHPTLERNDNSNFTSLDVFANSVNSPQFKRSVGMNDVWYELTKKGSGLLLTLKGFDSERIVEASLKWLATVNQIEDDLYLQKTNLMHKNRVDQLKSKVDFYENFESKFESDQIVGDFAIISILRDNAEDDSFIKLNDATFQLEKLKNQDLYKPTAFYLNKPGYPLQYFPSPIIYLGISFLISLGFVILILAREFRKIDKGD